MVRAHLILTASMMLIAWCFAVDMISPTLVSPTSFTVLRRSGNSVLYQIDLPPTSNSYKYPPLLVDLHGSRREIGHDYAALLHNETQNVFDNFVSSMFPSIDDQILINMFLDYCWDNFLSKYTPQEYLDELDGMNDFYTKSRATGVPINTIAYRYYTLANMPADTENIISMLEQELEGDWPEWLKTGVNYIIKLLEKLVGGCDAYGVWGSRTLGGYLFSSRNLDWNTNTGIDQYKLISLLHITDAKYGDLPGTMYSILGFTTGLGALAGMNSAGISVSEMNLDNSQVTFSGLAFPLRLRYILERSVDLQSATNAWLATKNTNSFNFLIGSATDALNTKENGNGAYALETMMNYTAFYGANSPVEKSATFLCGPGECMWTNETGNVHIGNPLPEAVWRSNHAFDPLVMGTQEPLFNDTVFRYNLMHDLFVGLENQQKIDDINAVSITATLGTKGKNFLSCDPNNFVHGENVMSVTYAPGSRGNSKYGYLYIAWEQGGTQWRPAACNPYVLIDFDQWMSP